MAVYLLLSVFWMKAFEGAVGAKFPTVRMWMKAMTVAGMNLGPLIFGVGLIGVLYTMLMWWIDVVREAEQGARCPRRLGEGDRLPGRRGDGVERLFHVTPSRRPAAA